MKVINVLLVGGPGHERIVDWNDISYPIIRVPKFQPPTIYTERDTVAPDINVTAVDYRVIPKQTLHKILYIGVLDGMDIEERGDLLLELVLAPHIYEILVDPIAPYHYETDST